MKKLFFVLSFFLVCSNAYAAKEYARRFPSDTPLEVYTPNNPPPGSSVSDNAYGAGWNGDTTTAPSKNAVYDKIETISAGSGITRTIVVTSGNVTAGATASTDYVYLVAGAHTVTMPTAVGNTNLYKIKNNHSANITIDTTSAQTIDGTTSISIAPEESVDLISDTANWRIQ